MKTRWYFSRSFNALFTFLFALLLLYSIYPQDVLDGYSDEVKSKLLQVTVSNNTPKVNEPVIFTIKLNNITDFDMKDADVYIQTNSDHIKISGNNSIIWRGNLKKSENATASITLTFNEKDYYRLIFCLQTSSNAKPDGILYPISVGETNETTHKLKQIKKMKESIIKQLDTMKEDSGRIKLEYSGVAPKPGGKNVPPRDSVIQQAEEELYHDIDSVISKRNINGKKQKIMKATPKKNITPGKKE